MSSDRLGPEQQVHALTPAEEIANTITHGFGFVLSLLGAAVLITSVLPHSDGWRIGACLVYSASLVAVYGMSTLSHSCRTAKWRQFFRSLDQGCIYLLIVGTYTPFSLTYLRSQGWWFLLGAMWFIAIAGFCSKVLFSHRVNAVSIWLYLLLGWMPLVAGFWIVPLVPAAVLWWVFVGGICYTLGTVFLIFDAHVFHFHAIWHLFVIAGSVCHYCGVLFWVVRSA